DARSAVGESFPERFPTVFELCRAHGLDPRVEPMPVSPAAHFHMGGVATDERGRASLRGLWACGEVASSGVHGANRLASNSLLEGLVYGARVADDVGRSLAGELRFPMGRASWAGDGLLSPEEGDKEVERMKEEEIRRLMWQEVGMERNEAGLRRASKELRRLSWWASTGSPRLRNLHTVATVVVAAALERRESRGGHFRSDFPLPDRAWQRRLFFILEEGTLEAAETWPEVARRPRRVGVEVRA
ncbi:MAG: FAD-binding protein, partial [Acidobacteria bacterium]|nr:FAD-binding protein [Acidobacteriota bacterium]